MLFSFLGGTCVAADDFRDNIPTRLVMARCDPNDTRQLFNLG
jgi:hypothetical protein